MSRDLAFSMILMVPFIVSGCGGGGMETGTSASGGNGGANSGGNGGDTSTQTTTASQTSTGTTTSGTSTIPADPISVPNEKWTWVPFNDAYCANGTTTGIGANITDKSKKVVIYLMGGGACWDNTTCYVLETASNIVSGYGDAEFDYDSKALLNDGLFDRNNADNPLSDASYFFVPYCTGDVHAGNNPAAVYNGVATQHVGYANVQAYLKRIVATFPVADRVVLSGSSAGGFGATLNWWAVQKAFGTTRVDLIDDSGPPLPSPYLSDSLEGQWRAAWNLNATLPEGCVACQDGLSNIFGFYAEALPKNRGALLSYTHDNVIASYFSTTEELFAEGLNLLGTELQLYPNFGTFFVEGNGHVLLGDPGGISQSGVSLQTFLSQMLSDDSAWKSIAP